MKRQNRKLYFVLLKSYFREIKPFPLIFAIAIISLLFIGGYKGYRTYTNEKNLKNAQELYGNYTLAVNNLSENDLQSIKKLCEKYKTETVYLQNLSTSAGTKVYGENGFFDVSNLELLEGKLPVNNRQILCEQKYLNQQGLSFSLDNKTYIELDGIKYLITGTMCVNDNIHIEGYYMPQFFLNYTTADFEKSSENYSLYIVTDTQESAFELKTRILQMYDIDDTNINFNNSVLIYTGLTESGESSDIILSICDKLFYLILALLVVIFISVISMRYKKMKSTIEIYAKLGLSKNSLILVSLFFITIVFVIATLFSIGALIFMLHLIQANIAILKHSLVFMVLFSILSIVLSVFSFSNVLSNRSIIRLKNTFIRKSRKLKKVERCNSELINAKHPFLKIAQINIAYGKKRYILSIIGTVLTIVILSSFLYSTNYINIDQGEYKYDYRVDYVYDSMADSYTGSKEIFDKYKDIMSSDFFDSYSIYYKKHTLKINKNSMDKNYINFLKSNDTEAFVELEHIDNKPFSARFIIIGADKEQQKNTYGLSEQYDLKDNECILINYVNTPTGKGFSTGLSKGESLTVSHYDYSTVEGGTASDFEVIVKEVVNDIDFKIQDSFYYPIIIVNKNVFNKISPLEYDYPPLLYLNLKSGSKTAANDFFKGTSGMLLTDLTEIKHMIDEQAMTSTISIFVMCILLTFILAINSSLNIVNKYNFERKQIATLKAIGIDNKHLIFNLVYEYILTILQSIIFGSVLSFLACYISHLYIREKVFYFVFEIPILYVSIPLITVVLIYILVAIPIYRKMRKMNIAETLNME